MKTLTSIRIFAIVLSAAWTASAAAEALMYKFTNADGRQVYSYTLPPGQAALGYQRVNMATGQVVETVGPKLSPEEQAAKERREQALAACQEELARLYALYGSERDIEQAREEAQEALAKRVGQLEGNLDQARERQERLSGRAADAERAGRPVPPDLLARIERGEHQMASLEEQIERRQQERRDVAARFDRELERYRDGTCPGSVAAN